MYGKLIALLIALLRRFRRKPKLNPVTNLEASVMAKNVKLSWKNPTQRVDGTTATNSDIKALIINAKLKALPDFIEVGRITDSAQIAAATANFPNTPGGTWIFQVGGIDTDDQSFAGVTEVEVVIPKAALNAVSDLAATLS